MCGIVGWIDWEQPERAPDRLRAMCDTIVHRGPDGAGYYEDGPVHLGHRRLSIIDLSTGDQPMSNEDGRVWIVFNGEIFNFQELRSDLAQRGHVFKTHSDTETIVHAYEEFGAACVDRLRGQFAFALWDGRREELFLARDRMGQKPLYYFHDGRRLVFGSELKALLAHGDVPREIDPEALAAYLRYRYVPDPLSIWSGVKKLPPAHWMVVSRAGVRIERYWEPAFDQPLDIDEPQALEQLDALLAEATRLQMISDVPLGMFLSGGIDSSLLTAYMARASTSPIKTFCIGFEERTHDERTYARQVAEKFGTEHEEYVVRPDALVALEEIVRFCDEPFADESALPVYYLSKMTRQRVTVALNGDGGDESFAGYSRYKALLQFNRFRQLPGWAQRCAVATANVAVRTPLKKIRALRRLHDWAEVMGASDGEVYERAISLWPGSMALLAGPRLPKAAANGSMRIAHWYDRCPSTDTIQRVLYADQHAYLPGDLLVKADRMTMAHSLEGRSPLLDHHVVDFAARLPGSLKVRGGCLKYLLKKLLERHFPPTFIQRPKMGFSVPVGAWLRNELRDVLLDHVRDSVVCRAGWLESAGVQKLVDRHLAGERNEQAFLWTFLVLEHWYRRWAT